MFSLFKKKYDSISAAELSEKLSMVNLIDVRENYEFRSGHVPKARNIPMSAILAEPEKYLHKDKEYHIICHSGSRSSGTSRRLSALGYKVVNVSGGTMSYTKPLKR